MQAGGLAQKALEGPARWSLQHGFPLALPGLPGTALEGGCTAGAEAGRPQRSFLPTGTPTCPGFTRYTQTA